MHFKCSLKNGYMAFERFLMVYNCYSKISLLSFFTKLLKVDEKQ